MARILVTGAAGFIGSHTCRALLARGDTVVGVDAFNAFYDPAMKEANAASLQQDEGFTLVRGTLLEASVRDACFAHGPIDGVIHLAAYAGVRPSIERPALYQRENIEATVALMDTMRSQPTLPKLVFASSSSVYGKNKSVPFSEEDNVDHPISPYAATKKAGELLCYTYHHLFALDVTCLRFFTVYGPGQRPDLAIHKFSRLLLEGQPIPRFGDGSTSRDYTFVADTVAGVLAALDRCAGYNIYNLGNNDTVTLNALIEKIAGALGVEAVIEQHADQPGDVPITWADISRAKADLDYAPSTSIDEGLKKFAEWFVPYFEQRRGQ